MTNPFNRPAGAATAAPASTPPRTAPVTAAAPGRFSGIDVAASADPYSFSLPTGLSEHKMSDFVGELLMVEPTEYIASMTTRFSAEPTDVFRVNMIPLTGELAENKIENMMVFQIALKPQLARTFQGPNRYLLARLGYGQAKPGMNPPYVFDKPSDADVELAEAWKARQRQQQSA